MLKLRFICNNLDPVFVSVCLSFALMTIYIHRNNEKENSRELCVFSFIQARACRYATHNKGVRVFGTAIDSTEPFPFLPLSVCIFTKIRP